MHRPFMLAALILVGGCTSLQSGGEQLSPEEQAHRDSQEAATRAYIDRLGAQRVDHFEIEGQLYILGSNQSFADVISASGRFIIEVEGPCERLIGARLQGCASSRRQMWRLPRNPESLFCGCRIKTIYSVENQPRQSIRETSAGEFGHNSAQEPD